MAYFRHFFSVDPAYAGMIPTRSLHRTRLLGGPRVCGDDPNTAAVPLIHHLWTPRVRG